MKLTWSDNKPSDLQSLKSLIKDETKDLDFMHNYMEILIESKGVIQLTFLKPLKEQGISNSRTKGKFSLAQLTREYRLEGLVRTLNQVVAILENFIAWTNVTVNEAVSPEVVRTMFLRVNKEIQVLHSYWTNDQLVVELNDGKAVENLIQTLDTHIVNIVSNMKANSQELHRMGVTECKTNNFINGDNIFCPTQDTVDKGCFNNAMLHCDGHNLFKTERVDMDCRIGLIRVELIGTTIIESLIHQMPEKYTHLCPVSG